MTAPRLPDRQWIAARIPHQGRMCLLDGVEAWDARQIRCRAQSHRAPDHPLRAHQRLGIATAIEYAAQAMAVHGALLASSCPENPDAPPPHGYLASMREVRFFRQRLDDLDDDLILSAERLSGDNRTVLYGFQVQAGKQTLVTGRAVVILDAGR